MAKRIRKPYNPNHPDAVNYRKHRKAHPDVYNWITAISRQAKFEKDYDHWSVSAAVEILRWSDKYIREKTDDTYKVNDHVGAYYAREIMMKEPDLFSFYRPRLSNADYEPLGVNGETWDEFEQRRLDAERQADFEEVEYEAEEV